MNGSENWNGSPRSFYRQNESQDQEEFESDSRSNEFGSLLGRYTGAPSDDVQRHALTKENVSHPPSNRGTMGDRFERITFLDVPFHPGLPGLAIEMHACPDWKVSSEHKTTTTYVQSS